MKKIIVFLICILSFCFTFSINASTNMKINVVGDVVGYINETVNKINIELSFTNPDQYFFNTDALTPDQDVSDWLINQPEECTYTATVYSVTSNKLVISISGSIGENAEEGETPIDIKIPYIEDNPSTLDVNEEVYYLIEGSNPYIADFNNIDNSNAHYVVLDESFIINYKGPYEIKGTVGEEIEPQIIEVIIEGGEDEFTDDILEAYLPDINGLTKQVTYLDDETYLEITITYTGTPLEPSQDLIHTTIPKEYMDLDIVDRVIPDRADVKFNIVSKEIPIVEPTKPDKLEPSFTLPKTGIN